MRVVALLVVVACSHPPKHNDPVQPVREDASVASEPVDAATSEVMPPDAAAAENVALFDWAAQRKLQDDARGERIKNPRKHRCKPDPNDPNKDPCTIQAGRLAAMGKIISVRDVDSKTVDLALDVGSDDGLTGLHWAAVIDDDGRRLTKFQRVLMVGPTGGKVRVENTEFGARPRVAVVPAPPREEKGDL
jgi:hypothetical protein